MDNCKLAIVIPYYKASFFDELLNALDQQSNRNFNLYIGDDYSPDHPDSIIKKYSDAINITYHRFPDRLGHISLARQWQRCLDLVKDEEWVWILPDDDLPSSNCVEEFYQALQSDQINNINVIRFPLNIIDQDGILIKKANQNPVTENNYQFYSRLIRGETEASLGDNIFRVSSLAGSDGIPDFPEAWGSDHAMILRASSGGLIYNLNNATFNFRMSNENISSRNMDGSKKMQARITFANWLKNNEDIFPEKPDMEFYKYFYWKGEHYVMHEWLFSISAWIGLYKLKYICTGSGNPLPVLNLLFTYLVAKITH